MMEFWTSPEAIPRRPALTCSQSNCLGRLHWPCPTDRQHRLPQAAISIAALRKGRAAYVHALGATCVAASQYVGMSTIWPKPAACWGVWAIVGGHECPLATSLAHLPIPIEGFGSSDCRSCRSHLLRWPGKSSTLLRRGIDSILTELADAVGVGRR